MTFCFMAGDLWVSCDADVCVRLPHVHGRRAGRYSISVSSHEPRQLIVVAGPAVIAIALDTIYPGISNRCADVQMGRWADVDDGKV